MFRHQLLGLLRDGNAHHGYGLVKEYVRRTGVETNSGYAYRDLQKLVDEGMVEVARSSRVADGRRRPYRITDAGRACFDEWFARVPPVQLGADGELAARAIFFDEVERERVVDVLTRWRGELETVRARLEQRIRFPGRKGASGPVLRAILERRRGLVSVEIGFLDDLLDAFRDETSEDADPAVSGRARRVAAGEGPSG